jgi:acetyl esterase
MQLHPRLGQLLDAVTSASAVDARADALEALRAAAREAYVSAGPDVPCRELGIPGPQGELRVRAYQPAGLSAASGGLIFFAAGGFVVGELYGHAALCQELALAAGCVVVAIEPRLAPEQPFPAAILDAYAATCWVHENADELAIDHRRIAIGGEGAGATLATAVCRLAKERRNPALAFQLLLYPWVDLRPAALAALPALARLAELYVPRAADREDPRCSPLAARNLIGVAPALIVSADEDALSDQIEAYAAALRAAHVPVTLRRYAGVAHGFIHDFARLPTARAALLECSAALRTALAT